MNHWHGTGRDLIPWKPLAPLSGLDGIGNKFNNHLAGGLANRTRSWKLHVVPQSSVNCTVSSLLYHFHPSAAIASKLMAVQWVRFTRTGFQPDQWAPDSCFSCTSARAGTTKVEGMGGWQGETLQQQRSLTSASANNKTPSSASCP